MLYIITTHSLQSLTLVTFLLPNSELLNFTNCNHHQQHHWNYNQFHYQHQTPHCCVICLLVYPGHMYYVSELCHTIFDAFHYRALVCIRATHRLITASYVSPNINSDICNWAQTWLKCQQCKVQRYTVTPFATPDIRLDNIHIDIVGLLPPSSRYTYILTCIDHFTCWAEAISIRVITAVSVAQAFCSGWIARFGVPSTITTDHGRQFESALWQQLIQLLGSKRNPIANGLIERFHCQLKASLKCSSKFSKVYR